MSHPCHWPGCGLPVPTAMWGCRDHWFALPYTLRVRILAAYRPGQELRPSADYLAAAKAAQAWIARRRRVKECTRACISHHSTGGAASVKGVCQMAARKVQSKVRVRGKGPPEVPIGPDARGNVRIYADISHAHSVELAVLAARGSVSKKAMLEKLIFDAVERARIA